MDEIKSENNLTNVDNPHALLIPKVRMNCFFSVD